MKYDIPGFSRYYATYPPFRVTNGHTGHTLNPIRSATRSPRLGLRGDDGAYYKDTVYHFAALAFHGQQPPGYKAVHYGGPVTPRSVQWVPERDAMLLWRSKKLTRSQRYQIVELYLKHPDLSQREIAERFGVHSQTVSYHINKMLGDSHDP